MYMYDTRDLGFNTIVWGSWKQLAVLQAMQEKGLSVSQTRVVSELHDSLLETCLNYGMMEVFTKSDEVVETRSEREGEKELLMCSEPALLSCFVSLLSSPVEIQDR